MKKVSDVLKNNDMVPFLVGSETYHIEPMRECDEPHNYDRLWRLTITPFLESAHEDEIKIFYQEFEQALTKLCSYKDSGLGYYTIFSHLLEYYSFIYSHPAHESGLDIKRLGLTVSAGVTMNKKHLLKDKRWAGADWNSKGYGLLGVFIGLSKRMQKNSSWPSFVGAEIESEYPDI